MRVRRVGGVSLLVLGMLAQSFPASGQPTEEQAAEEAPADGAAPAGSSGATPAPAAPQGNAPDIVELKDGGMYRGTISEKVPGDHVVIVTVTGASKTFDMEDVKYAGPAAQAPGAAPSAPPAEKPEGEPQRKKEKSVKPVITLHADEARLFIKGPGLTLYRKGASAIAVGPGGGAVASGYDVICAAPCDASLPAGTHILAVSDKDGSPVETGPVTLPAGESRLTAHYEKKSRLRVAGWLVFGGGIAAGSALMFAGMTKTKQDCSLQDITGTCTDESYTDTAEVALGGVLMAAGVAIGLAMALQRDKATVKVAPIDAGLLRHPTWSNPALDRAWVHSPGAPGLGLTARF